MQCSNYRDAACATTMSATTEATLATSTAGPVMKLIVGQAFEGFSRGRSVQARLRRPLRG